MLPMTQKKQSTVLNVLFCKFDIVIFTLIDNSENQISYTAN